MSIRENMVNIMDNKNRKISAPEIKRLPKYYCVLDELSMTGVERISSKELAARMGSTASQIRQDLNCFGGFGQQGYGYSVNGLMNEIGNILSVKSVYNAVLIGAGNLASAVAFHLEYLGRGLRVIGVFDNVPRNIGKNINGISARPMDEIEEFCSKNHVDAAILCVPKTIAAEAAERLCSAGIRNFWNFSRYDILLKHDDVIVEDLSLSESLMVLCYKISESKDKKSP